MGQALYRKYRSKALAEIVGQDHITTTLSRALADGQLAHAYLFTGPRGTGKTSIARILAHQINDLPYTDESIHLDIIEIDAASNRRIDEIRDLRDKIHIAPTSAKYKVYIIDEVHMLTKEAFNALLKTLEEPPAHVIFILATTELHKVPDTIVSRTQRFTFKPVEQSRVVQHLRSIADQESIDIDDEALSLVADHGGGSFRDSISLLDQLRNSPDKPVSADTVRLVLGVPKLAATEALLAAVLSGQSAAVMQQLRDLQEQGFAAPQIAAQLYDLCKARLLNDTSSGGQVLPFMEHLLSVSGASDTALQLELVCLQACFAGQATPAVVASSPAIESSSPAPPAKSQASSITPPTQVAPTPPPPAASPSQAPAAAPEPVQKAAPNPPTPEPLDTSESTEPEPAVPEPSVNTPAPSSGSFDLAHWPSVLGEAKNHNNTLYGVLRMAHPSVEGNKLILAFAFPFHQKRINDSKHKAFISDAVMKVCGQAIHIEVIVDKTKGSTPTAYEADDNPPPPIAPPADLAVASTAPSVPDVNSVMAVFGGGEVL